MANLEKMNKFLITYNVPRLDLKETEYTNRPITSNEIKSSNKTTPTNKSPGPDGFTCEFYQTFREKLTPILCKLFQNLQRKKQF